MLLHYSRVVMPIKATTGGQQSSSAPSITKLFHCQRQLCWTITNPWSYIVMVPSVCWYVVDKPVVCYSSNMLYSFNMPRCPGSKIFKATTGGRKLGHRPPVVALKVLSVIGLKRQLWQKCRKKTGDRHLWRLYSSHIYWYWQGENFAWVILLTFIPW